MASPAPSLPPPPPPYSPSPPFAPPSDDDLALPLGLGLGIGIPALLLVGYLVWAYMARAPGTMYNWTPWAAMSTGAAAAGGIATAMIPSATIDVGVPASGGKEPGLYAVVSGNRWFWSVGGAK
jgi:hypothetical protein